MEKTEEKTTNNTTIEEMIEAGLGFGHQASKLHPKMKPYITKMKDGIGLINLEITREKLEEALKFLEQAKKEQKTFLFVSTSPSLRSIVKDTAEKTNSFYVVERWIGGLLTNFSEIKKRLKYFEELEAKIAEPDFTEKYVKKERLQIMKTLERLKAKFGGVKGMEKIPDVVIIINLEKDKLALLEALGVQKTIVAITDTNVDPTEVNYMIPANDDAVSSVTYILDKISKSIE
ncbi:MAG: 30S ribosomal protein S2 [Candidatus Pacebacteria bacterium]|nr:30S ribosomal protein S2 [Candidatus Paceibacterota bacterium]MDD3047919.1 30S ribosomal protein S2 [Candidatus Paceibacterota bacterium]MDD3510010.1 30S ribosomal protein S2 [Candidatus Paceibacterota bacterium]MDD3918507.1 30S ribosomal protein S2 [Candidatus Paceibacterota bacterium]MDD4664579.1 30S ribosomal protein S2 [Candidatus Paceibacterota bacterium]